MDSLGFRPTFDTDEKSTSSRIWVLFFFVAFLVHLLFFRIHVPWETTSAPRPIALQQIDPEKLEQIRKKWKEKALLLDKDKTRPKEQTAPDDARYMSDRNIRVEKEQRAKNSAPLPVPGQTRQNPSRSNSQSSTSNNNSRSAARRNLGSLGLPFRLNAPVENSTPVRAHDAFSDQYSKGADQSVLDKDLPEGSENLLNAQESIYYSFYSRIYEAIAPVWTQGIREVSRQLQLHPRDYTTVVEIVLDQGGHLRGIKHLQSSGVDAVDRVVDDSWRRVEQFPNPPQGLLDDNRLVHIGWTFRLEIGEGFQFNFLPPQRNY